MMPRLQAEEAIDASRVVALGSGTLKQGVAGQMLRGLERQAGPPGSRPPAVKADPAMLAAMGIGVKVVPAKGGQEAKGQ